MNFARTCSSGHTAIEVLLKAHSSSLLWVRSLAVSPQLFNEETTLQIMKGHNPRWMENMPFLVEFVVAWRLTMLTSVLEFSRYWNETGLTDHKILPEHSIRCFCYIWWCIFAVWFSLLRFSSLVDLVASTCFRWFRSWVQWPPMRRTCSKDFLLVSRLCTWSII